MKTSAVALLALAVAAALPEQTRRRPALPMQIDPTQPNKTSVGGFTSVVVHRAGLTVQEPPKGWPFSEVNINFPSKDSTGSKVRSNLYSAAPPAPPYVPPLVHSHNDLHKSAQSQEIPVTSAGTSFESQKHLHTQVRPSLEPIKKPTQQYQYNHQHHHLPHHQLKQHQQHQLRDEFTTILREEPNDGVEYITVDLKNKKPTKRVPKPKPQSSAVSVGYSIGFITPPDAFKPAREVIQLAGNTQKAHSNEGNVVLGRPVGSHTTELNRKPRVHSGQSTHTYSVHSTPLNHNKISQHDTHASSPTSYQGVSSATNTDGKKNTKYVWKNVGANVEVSSNVGISSGVQDSDHYHHQTGNHQTSQHETRHHHTIPTQVSHSQSNHSPTKHIQVNHNQGKKDTRVKGGRGHDIGQHTSFYYVGQGSQPAGFDHAHALGHSDAFDVSNAVLGSQGQGSSSTNTHGTTAINVKDHALFVHQGNNAVQTSGEKTKNVFSGFNGGQTGGINFGYTLGNHGFYNIAQGQQQHDGNEGSTENHGKNVASQGTKGGVLTSPLTPYNLGPGLGIGAASFGTPNAYLAGIHTGGQGNTIPALVIPMANIHNLQGLAGALHHLQAQGAAQTVIPTQATLPAVLQTTIPTIYAGQPMPYATVATGFKSFQLNHPVSSIQSIPVKTVTMQDNSQTSHSPQHSTVTNNHQLQPVVVSQGSKGHNFNLVLGNPRPQQQVIQVQSVPNQGTQITSSDIFRLTNSIPYMHQHLNNQKNQLVRNPQVTTTTNGIKLQQTVPYYQINVNANKDQNIHQQLQNSHASQEGLKEYYQQLQAAALRNQQMLGLQDLMKVQQGVPYYHHINTQPAGHQHEALGQSIRYYQKAMNDQAMKSALKAQQQSLDKEQLHREILAQQRALANYNSMLSLALFQPAKTTAQPATASTTQANGSVFPLPSSYLLDLKPPPMKTHTHIHPHALLRA